VVTSDRARRSGGVETNKANDCADGTCDSGATSEIAAHIRAKCQTADSQSDESHGLADGGSGAIRPYRGGAARRLTWMARVGFRKHDWLLFGFGHVICGDAKRQLTAPTVRFSVRDRARVMPGSGTGIEHWCTGSRRGDPLERAPARTPTADRAR
jgi:hypothetical protein